MQLSSQDYLLLLSDSEILRLHLLAKFRYRQALSVQFKEKVSSEQTLPPNTIDGNSKKTRPLGISEVEMMATTTAIGSSTGRPKLEPPTPTKKSLYAGSHNRNEFVLINADGIERKFLDSRPVQLCSIGRLFSFPEDWLLRSELRRPLPMITMT
ncbi:hypothetical protein H5410_035177 [Solanum commersonii]|uniref:Uncharacterized protein n=1 Tax=Solanum commersonii TaxID=4109 RepID=A0A9J5Y0H1_SOLCO|nr:hypothetical protein H5410_035177 [Solanum commersonii]